jgi:hypothetical protein
MQHRGMVWPFRHGLVVISVPQVPIWKPRYFNALRLSWRDWFKTGGADACRICSLRSLGWGWGVEWILKSVVAGEEDPCADIMEISKPDNLGDIANPGLTLLEAKPLLAQVQREISTAQAREHAVRRPFWFCRKPSADTAAVYDRR